MFCLQTGNYQSCTAAKIGTAERGTMKRIFAVHHGDPSLQPDIGPHAQKLRYMTIAVFKHVFHKYRGTLTAQKRCHDNGLCIGREAGVGSGTNGGDGVKPAVRLQRDQVFFSIQRTTCLL